MTGKLQKLHLSSKKEIEPKQSAENYRPVSPMCISCKVFESILKDHILSHIDQHDLFTTKQHGLIAGRSCLSNLLETFKVWTEALDNDY